MMRFCDRSEKGEKFPMQLQLYALPVSALSQGDTSFEQSEVSYDKLNCLLQASGLPQGQRLEVHVNDTLKKWQEGSNQVFSWELQEYGDEISIHLCHDATEIASWRSLWKGNAIFHLGALPVRVFFNGIEQPLVEASTMIQIFDASRDPFPTNGREAAHVLSPEHSSVNDREVALPIVEIAEEPLSHDTEVGETEGQQEKDEELQDEEEYVEDEEEENEEEDDYEEDEDLQEEKRQLVLKQDHPVLAEEQPDESSSLEEGMVIAPVEEEKPQGEAQTHRADVQEGSTVGKVAVFHIDSNSASRTLERLKALLSMMPKKTAIIDLRELSRNRQKEEYYPLSRAHLRDDFGGRYWDRSQYIKTTYRSLPNARRAMNNQWERVVTDIDNPEGLPYLEKYLREGYSMIFMDSVSLYEESARRAVVIALQERNPTLEEVKLPS